MDHIMCKSRKLWAMPCRAIQDRWRVLTKCGPLEKGTGNHFSIFALKTPWRVWKGKRYDLARWGPRSVGFQKATGEERKNSLRKKNEEAEPKQKGHPVVDVSVGESKFWHYKEVYCIRTWNGRSMNQGKFSSVQFNRSVMPNSLWPHVLLHPRLPCQSPTPRAYSNSCWLCQWCHPTITSSVVPFSYHLQSFPASGAFPMSQFFASCGQSFGVSASASVLPRNIQDWFPLGLTGWISLQSKGLSRVFSNTIVQKYQFFGTQLSL